MKPRLIQRRPFAFTLLELLALITIICILAALLLPAGGGPRKARRIVCLNNQRQIATGFIVFADEHQHMFPIQTLSTNGSELSREDNGSIVGCYLAVSNWVHDASMFHCPGDRNRNPVSNVKLLSRTNTSYFISLDASPTNAASSIILTGDRHLQADGKPVTPGLFVLTPNQTLAWTSELHPGSKGSAGGAFSFADGHAELVSPTYLVKVVARQSMPTNRLAVP